MNKLLSKSSSVANRDFLSMFKNESEKSLTIQQGMTNDEISEIVSEKIISIIKKQFREIEKRELSSP